MQKEIALRDVLVQSGHWKCCLNCWQWGAPESNPNLAPHCRKYSMMPPAKILVLGCIEHTPDIPF
ncbi:hypothetical protein Knedl_CDS0052 [Pseudomonas phage Knedl]|nr:hypothetical protein Knedl_CDS0052 [Pseudomonas phage Knedl]